MIVPGSAHPFLMAGNVDPLDNLGVIARSLRFRPAASASLNRTFGAPTNNKIFTLFGWVKRADLNNNYRFFGATNGSTNSYIGFGNGGSGDSLVVTFDSVTVANGELTYPPAYRDPGDHMFVVIGVDTTQATAANRVTVEVNGVALPAPSGAYPAQNSTPILNGARKHYIGAQSDTAGSAATFFSGLWSFFGMVDGTKLSSSSFGVAHPITSQFRTYSKTTIKAVVDAGGANSFFLPFDDPTNTTTLCADASAKGNNWTATNVSLTAGITYDSLTDTPTNNYPVLNPISGGTGAFNVLSNGALTLSNSSLSGTSGSALSTMGVNVGDSWYFEATATAVPASAGNPGVYVGIVPLDNSAVPTIGGNAPQSVGGYAYRSYTGNKVSPGGDVAYGATYTAGDVIGVMYSNGSLTFYKNNVSQGVAFTGISGTKFAAVGSVFQGGTLDFNFGQRAFAYPATAGSIKAICTKNLTFPTLPKPAAAFVAVTDTGANVQTTLANARPGWGTYIEIFKRRDASEGWRWRFSDDLSNYLDSSSTAAKAAFPSLTGTSYVGYAIKVAAPNGVAMGRLVHTNGVADTVTDALGNSRKMVILKNEATGTWYVYHPDLTAGKLLYLNSAAGETSDTTIGTVTTNSFTVAAALASGTYRWIAFAELDGFCKLLTYAGNGSADGPFESMGLSPMFDMTKRKDASGESYLLMDRARNLYNVTTGRLYFDLAAGEDTSGLFDMVSNGVKFRQGSTVTGNQSGATYVGLAFAQFPFRYANAQ